MTKLAYWDAIEGRPKIAVDWTTPDGSLTQDVEFVVDSGAERSTVREYLDAQKKVPLAAKRGLQFRGLVNVKTAGAPAIAVEVEGGLLEFEVLDAAGFIVRERFSGPVLILSGNLIANDAMASCGLVFSVDHRTQPPGVKLQK